MNQEQLLAQYLQLKRKLAMSCQVWPSGRIDRLTDAMRSVERELLARQVAA